MTQISWQGIISHPFHPLPGTEYYAHMPARELKAVLGPEVWESYYKFANIRNPFDAVVSAYFDQKQRYESGLTFANWWFELIPHNDFIWDVIQIDKSLAVDCVIRYEALLEDVGRVCEILDIEYDSRAFPQLRTTERPSRHGRKLPYREVIPYALIDDIQAVFEQTCAEFGYRYQG